MSDTSPKPPMGRIAYLNVLPVYHALETGEIPHGYALHADCPAVLNAMVRDGRLAVSPVSCIEYARHPDKYLLIPDLAVASDGPVRSVLLLSRLPLAELDGREVLRSAQSHTSLLLADMLLRDMGVTPRYTDGQAGTRIASATPPDAVLVIGDEALRLADHPAYSFCLDLGLAWREWTGLPFVYALWAVNRAAVSAGRLAEDPSELLRASRDRGLAEVDAVIARAAAETGWPVNRLREYYTGLRYHLGERELHGLRHFYGLLAAHGEIGRCPDLVFWSGS